MIVGVVNLQKYDMLPEGLPAVAKVRYKDHGTPCILYNDENKIRAEFDTRVKAIAPGQSAVFYEGSDVIGGGIIHSSFDL